MSTHFSKLIDTPAYHLWTDALHARALANQATNKWNRDTYVRWTVTTAWTAFEMSCKEAANADHLGNDFKRNLGSALDKLSLPKLNWGKGLWQRVAEVYKLRKEYVHGGVPENHVFRETVEADFAVITLRDAGKAIYTHAHKQWPLWIEDDEDPGWDNGRNPMAHPTVIYAGTNPDDADTLRIAYVFRGKEHITQVLPPGTDTSTGIEDIIQAIRVPISAVRVYKGSELIMEKSLRMRGA